MSRYADDVLAPGWQRAGSPTTTEVPAELGMVLEDPTSGFVGAVLRWENGLVVLEDRHGKRRSFPLGPGFWLDGRPVALVAPRRATPATRTHTASGSRVGPTAPAKVALPSRLYVEGRHDAELVEKVWGHDLRVEGVVVELLGGVDELADALAEFGPTPQARAGVLVDHLVAGSRESRIVADVASRYAADRLLIVGHPFVDVWQAVRPERIGLERWPVIPRDVEWKAGVSAALGLSHTTSEDIGLAWRHILARVRTYADLEPSFSGRVEELIDFVTVPGAP